MPANRLSALLLILAASPAAAQPLIDVQFYLARNAIQQVIFLSRQLNAQRDLVEECAPDIDAPEFRLVFNDWLANHPQVANRPAQFAVTAALFDLCE